MKRSMQKGFTLIELMIVVAIIGILASVALPAYQTYTYKAQMSEVILAATTCRTAVSEKYATGSVGPGANGWGCEAGASGKYIAAITTTANGAASVQITSGTMGLTGTTNYVYLQPMASATTPITAASVGTAVHSWRCGGSSASVLKLLPGSCNHSFTAVPG